jgi:alkaline phosphatase
MKRAVRTLFWSLIVSSFSISAFAQTDHLKQLQETAMKERKADWGHWGPNSESYSNWTSHSNRLIPVYTFGIDLKSVHGEKSVYRDADKLKEIYGHAPTETVNPNADYFDQTDIYRLQKMAIESGKKKVILMVFDGMDWQTTQAAAIVNSRKVYTEGKGSGLSFLDYSRDGVITDYGYMVTSPANDGTNMNVDAQKVTKRGETLGGYHWKTAGEFPWSVSSDLQYLIGKGKTVHAYTDSSSSATSMTCGIKTFNDGVNVDIFGRPVTPLAVELQEKGFAVGVVTSVPISHATPACAYASNVHRDDYQDLTNDMLGVPSISHPGGLSGLDVVIGGGWGENRDKDGAQGKNFVPGNRYLTEETLKKIDSKQGGSYVIAQRTAGKNGNTLLAESAQQAIAEKKRLLGYFGTKGGHLPFRTADGNYDPTISAGTNRGIAEPENYSPADVSENPALPEMSIAALDVLDSKADKWWLMVEAGDVDWANHANNIDNSVGAVFSGANAFASITAWLEQKGYWNDTIIIVTADHGHYLTITKPERLLSQSP